MELDSCLAKVFNLGAHEVQNSKTTSFLSLQPSSHSSWPFTHSNPDSPFMRSSNQSKSILCPSKGLFHPGLLGWNRTAFIGNHVKCIPQKGERSGRK